MTCRMTCTCSLSACGFPAQPSELQQQPYRADRKGLFAYIKYQISVYFKKTTTILFLSFNVCLYVYIILKSHAGHQSVVALTQTTIHTYS